jgi:uncharacterized protein involved in exopolysaccharide biosynthesis
MPLPLQDDATPGIGWLEVALPLWHRRWRLVLSALLGLLLSLALVLAQPVRFSGRASFVVQSLQRPSQSGVANALPALAGLAGAGPSAIDLHVAVLRSRTVADRIIERFDLQKAWGHVQRAQTQQLLARRVEINIGRREGVVTIDVEDDHPQRAAAIANQLIDELRAVLRGFALDEARQRRAFYEAQLARARESLAQAQKALQASGYDRAALRAEPRAAAEAYARLQAEATAAELRLSAARRVRADDSQEVRQQQGELAALRAQLAGMEAPRDGGPGSFVSRLRDFRYAETLVESIARQAEAARVDEDAEPAPLQLLDRAQVPPWPSSPRIPLWLLAGLGGGLLLQAAWVLLRHRAALARQQPLFQQRLAEVRAVLPPQRAWWRRTRPG